MSPADTDLTAQLAEALFRIDTDRVNRGGLSGRSYEDVAATLLPVVREYGDQRAAEGIRRAFIAAADEASRLGRRGPNATADWLLDFGQDHTNALLGEAGR